MLKVMLAVDGSSSAARATETLVKTLGWYREAPHIDLLAVHLPVPRFANMSLVVSEKMIEAYYADECNAMLALSREILDRANAEYAVRTAVGPIAETIIEQAKQRHSDMIYMGTRGMTALSNMVMGSVATRVLHLAHIPVVLIH